LFLNKQYAQANSHYATTPRAFLLSLTSAAPPHALLVAHWGSEGAALLSLPTKEYFQSSGWVEEKPVSQPNPGPGNGSRDVQSVRSGSGYWADGRTQTPSSSAFWSDRSNCVSGAGDESNLDHSLSLPSEARPRSRGRVRDEGGRYHPEEDDDNDSQVTEVPGGNGEGDDIIDEVGAQDAFIAGMIYALSRRLVPGSPYTPSWTGEDVSRPESDRGRWRLDECLRFATELAGRKARRQNWDGLADEMTRAGWFDS